MCKLPPLSSGPSQGPPTEQWGGARCVLQWRWRPPATVSGLRELSKMATKKTVDTWMAELPPSLRRVAEALRSIILEAGPGLSEAIKWENPVYEWGGRVAYLAATESYVSLGFFNGASLTDPDRQIEGTGKKMRHVKVRRVEDIQRERYLSWVRQAVALNEAE